MRIAIDAHQIGTESTGVETYVSNLVKNLARLEPNGEKYDVYLGARKHPEELESNPCFRTREIGPLSRPLRFAWFFPLESWRKKFDVFHAQFVLPPFLRGKTVVTVHDLAYERFPQHFKPRVRLQMKILVREACRNADHIIAVSESTKRDLIDVYGIDPRRVTVTYPGVQNACRPVDREQAAERLRGRYGVDTPYLLYVGLFEPRKNLLRLIEAFAELRKKDRIPHKLVVVGPKAWGHDEVSRAAVRHHLEREVILTGYVPAEDLAALYSAATVMVYPSLFEGFGSPVAEAMTCGTPVITSLGSSLEEIARDAAVLVDPYSVSSIASAIERVTNDADLQERLRVAALARAAQFSYRRMAEQTRAIYQQL